MAAPVNRARQMAPGIAPEPLRPLVRLRRVHPAAGAVPGGRGLEYRRIRGLE